MSNHGYISCLGPVVDIQLLSAVYREDRITHSGVRETLLYLDAIGQKAITYTLKLIYSIVYVRVGHLVISTY